MIYLIIGFFTGGLVSLVMSAVVSIKIRDLKDTNEILIVELACMTERLLIEIEKRRNLQKNTGERRWKRKNLL